MEESFVFEDFTRLLLAGARRVESEKDRLSELDSHGGDGDHGTTVARAMEFLQRTVDGWDGQDPKQLLYDVGWAIMGIDGGATGPLFGAFFMGMSDTYLADTPLDATHLTATFQGGLENVQRQTKAKVGDKTLIDALVPAVEAMKHSATQGANVEETFLSAAEAAEKGAVSTSELQARFGRAKNVGAQSLGFQDPGATSVALLFKGFAEGLGEK